MVGLTQREQTREIHRRMFLTVHGRHYIIRKFFIEKSQPTINWYGGD